MLLGRLANPFASVTREEIREATRRCPFSRWLPYLAYDPERGLYINRDGTAGFMFESPPLPAADENTHRSLTGMLDLVPPRGVLSVTLISFPYLDPVVERYARLKKRAAENPVLAGAIKRYTEHLKHWTRGIPHLLGTPLRDFHLIFALKVPVSDEKDLEALAELKTAFRETLRGAHLVPREFGPEALIHTLFLLFNGRPEPNLHWDPERPLYDHLILSETPVEVRKGKLQIGPSTFRALTFKQVAPDVNLLKLGELFGGSRGPIDDTNQIPSHFLYTVFFVHVLQLAKQRIELLVADVRVPGLPGDGGFIEPHDGAQRPEHAIVPVWEGQFEVSQRRRAKRIAVARCSGRISTRLRRSCRARRALRASVGGGRCGT